MCIRDRYRTVNNGELRKNHIEERQNTILNGGDWVVNIKSVRNVLFGENFVYAFPEITENKTIVRKGEIDRDKNSKKSSKKSISQKGKAKDSYLLNTRPITKEGPKESPSLDNLGTTNHGHQLYQNIQMFFKHKILMGRKNL